MKKPWYRSRIIWLNLIIAGAGAAIGTGILPSWATAALTIIVAMVNVVLRYDTTEAIE